MKEQFADYADNYDEYKAFIFDFFRERPPCDGFDAQCQGLYFLNENDLTERERLIMMLSVIKWEIENNMLTKELKNELDYYYDELSSGRLYEHIRNEDVLSITNDLTCCYKKVFE